MLCKYVWSVPRHRTLSCPLSTAHCRESATSARCSNHIRIQHIFVYVYISLYIILLVLYIAKSTLAPHSLLLTQSLLKICTSPTLLAQHLILSIIHTYIHTYIHTCIPTPILPSIITMAKFGWSYRDTPYESFWGPTNSQAK